MLFCFFFRFAHAFRLLDKPSLDHESMLEDARNDVSVFLNLEKKVLDLGFAHEHVEALPRISVLIFL